jgi:DNA-binding XRE family transcriptional regulator
LPFCHLALKAKKPKPAGYPKALNTLGDRLRARRLDLGLYQKDVATIIGVSEDTICYWENNSVKPSKRRLTKITDFLDGVAKME